MKGSHSKEEATSDNAKIYVKEIKAAFKDEKHKFNEFLKAMKDFKKKRISVARMLTRVKKLFEGHRELLLKFNTYLPEEFEITPPSEKPLVDIEYARKYLDKVKTRFQDDPDVYQSFVAILIMYRHKEKSSEEIAQMIFSLFEDQYDLVDGFMEFLP
ncbi:hypothetical protein KIW84_023408 [Lathyrus oleraceus]|uniref:Uncharacterized protein n=1 Tax=Pisum sativum TaxID=3888 RepID=A0A9D4YDR2_PEA|nr:hypothetical protein KIW84_023408 [Pisum sativum]